MDPVAHTLLGAALAETGLKKLSRYAGATLIIGANLPDIDVVAQFWGEDVALYVRRGWSHGILALVILPLLLAGAVWAWHRWRGAQRSDAPPFHLTTIIALAYLGTWSHPLLDWLNTYGVRLLMPFSDTWYYGDTLFIVDPWFWLLSAAGLVLACNHRGALVGWALLATLASLLIFSSALAPLTVKIIWLSGIIALAAVRWRRTLSGIWTARVSLATLTLYVGSAYGLARLAEAKHPGNTNQPRQVQANPMPGNPFAHRTITVYADHYLITEANGIKIEVPRQTPNAIVQAAMDDESIKGFAHWLRFPHWDVSATDDTWIVEFRDLRYLNPDDKPRGIGYAKVEISRSDFAQHDKARAIDSDNAHKGAEAR